MTKGFSLIVREMHEIQEINSPFDTKKDLCNDAIYIFQFFLSFLDIFSHTHIHTYDYIYAKNFCILINIYIYNLRGLRFFQDLNERNDLFDNEEKNLKQPCLSVLSTCLFSFGFRYPRCVPPKYVASILHRILQISMPSRWITFDECRRMGRDYLHVRYPFALLHCARLFYRSSCSPSRRFQNGDEISSIRATRPWLK